jgi:hypothetical protein
MDNRALGVPFFAPHCTSGPEKFTRIHHTSPAFLRENSNFNTKFEFSRKNFNFALLICILEYVNVTAVDPAYCKKLRVHTGAWFTKYYIIQINTLCFVLPDQARTYLLY